jgi:hypothetical protein
LIAEIASIPGVVKALAAELEGVARRTAVQYPRMAISDLAVMIPAGGDCPAHLAMLIRPTYSEGRIRSDGVVEHPRPRRRRGHRNRQGTSALSGDVRATPGNSPAGRCTESATT